jgi:hypothetical protein
MTHSNYPLFSRRIEVQISDLRIKVICFPYLSVRT